MNRKFFTFFGVSLCMLSLIALVGCPSPGAKPTQTPTGDWWNNPGSLQLGDAYITSAVGSADMKGQRSFAIAKAKRVALLDVAMSLGAKVQALATDWAKEAGDALKESSQSSFYNNETVQRTFVNEVVKGAQTVKVKWEGKTVYVLMGIRAPGFFKAFREKIGSDLKTMAFTDVMKEEALNKLDAQIDKAEKKAKERGSYKFPGEKAPKKKQH